MYIDLYFNAYMYAYMYVCIQSCVCMQVSFKYVSRPVYIDSSQLIQQYFYHERMFFFQIYLLDSFMNVIEQNIVINIYIKYITVISNILFEFYSIIRFKIMLINVVLQQIHSKTSIYTHPRTHTHTHIGKIYLYRQNKSLFCFGELFIPKNLNVEVSH